MRNQVSVEGRDAVHVDGEVFPARLGDGVKLMVDVVRVTLVGEGFAIVFLVMYAK